MSVSRLIAVVLMTAVQAESLVPIRTAPLPDVWNVDDINNGLPYRWEKGTVHVLAWETTEESGHGRRSSRTQILVLKRFDEPTETGGYRWVLAHLYHRPKDKVEPWGKHMLHIPPVRPGEKLPKLTDAQVFGHELYKALPTDEQIATFLRETCWAPTLGTWQASTLSGGKVVTVKYVTRLAAGGVDRTLWKELFGREVPTDLFHELTRPTVEKKR